MNQVIKKSEWPVRVFFFFLILIAGNSCARRKPETASIYSEKEISLIKRVEENRFSTTSPSSVKIGTVRIDNQRRKVLLQHTKSAVTFPEIPIHPGAKLRFGLAVSPESRDKPDDGVEFSIILVLRGEEYKLFERYVDTKPNLADRRWYDFEIDLSEFAGRDCALIFQTDSGAEGKNANDWAGWSFPLLVSEGRPLTLRSPEANNVILITADTLRADYLSCYGKKEMQTPHLDSLAEEGTLFENHYSQCNSTLPSHASILSSLYLKDHGIYDNSTPLPVHILTLPIFLRLSGFQTAAFVSVAHLNPEISGLGDGFDLFSYSPSPKVDKTEKNQRLAEETNKEVFHWLESNRDFRFFLWIHYFDPHSPYKPPSPFRDLYYTGNPLDPANQSMQPLLRKRLEHLAWLENKTDRLQAGFLDEDFLNHLQTSLNFRWGVLSMLKKDHQNLQKGRTLDEVIEWASDNIDRFIGGKPLSPEFQDWLIHFAKALKVEKKDLREPSQPWLAGITDYDFVVRQYMGEITYLDAQIGELIKTLKNFNLKDSTLMVFTADHGESMGEHDIFFGHRGLFSPVIRVPLIMSGPGVKKGARISIQTDSVDIFPSILDMMDLPAPSFMRGQSLAKMIRGGRTRSPHKEVSFSEHAHGYQVSARTEKFTYIETLSSSELFNFLKENTPMSKGEIQLYRSSDPLEKEDIARERPDIVRMFNRLVHDWLDEKKPRLDKGTKEMDPETQEMLKALGYIR